MSLQQIWKRRIVSSLLLGLINLGFLTIADAHNNDLQHPLTLLEEYRTKILLLSSDKEALKLNRTFMDHLQGPQQAPAHQRQSRKLHTKLPIPPEVQKAITTFWAAMTTLGYAQDFQTTPEPSPEKPTSWELPFPSERQLEWILSKPSLEEFNLLVSFKKGLSSRDQQTPVSLPDNNHSTQFAEYSYHVSSKVRGDEWINHFSHHGFKGIRTRLHEYWEQTGQQSSQQPVPDYLKQRYIQYYMESRLLPLFHANLEAQAKQIEAQAYEVAWESWHRIQQWQQEAQAHQALRRLCGSWKWIIHNHQNHGDHKTKMTFSSPEDSTPVQVQPSTILIHGNTVYLKWIFPQGIQEDSLLLSNHDTRLEGTFTNSQGPNGSISGQRLSPCRK